MSAPIPHVEFQVDAVEVNVNRPRILTDDKVTSIVAIVLVTNPTNDDQTSSGLTKCDRDWQWISEQKTAIESVKPLGAQPFYFDVFFLFLVDMSATTWACPRDYPIVEIDLGFKNVI